MKNKILVLLCILLLFGCSNKNNNVSSVYETTIKNEESINNSTTISNQNIKSTESNKTINNDIIYENWGKAIYELLNKTYKWDEFPLSETFKNKYKSARDIVKGTVVSLYSDNESLFTIDESIKDQTLIITSKTGDGLEQIAYLIKYTINANNELDDLEIIDKKVIENIDGSYPVYDSFHYYIDDPITVTYRLVFPESCDYNYKVFVTKNFENKFNNYLGKGIIDDDKYLIFGDVKQDERDKNICYAEFLDVNITKYYKIIYEINPDGYINDATIELVETKTTANPEYVKELYNGYIENH